MRFVDWGPHRQPERRYNCSGSVCFLFFHRVLVLTLLTLLTREYSLLAVDTDGVRFRGGKGRFVHVAGQATGSSYR